MPKATPPTGTRVLYTLDRERTYHFVTGVLLALAGIAVGLATLLTPEEMVREFGSVAIGRGVQLALSAVGCCPLLAWLRWIRRYARRITWLADVRRVRIDRCGYVGVSSWILAPAEIENTTAHAGRADVPGAPTVDAPYRRLHLRGRRALILDEQGTTHDGDALAAILSGREPP